MRVTTVRFGAPRSQAAGCLIRLQLPLCPSTRAGGSQRPPPPREGDEKVRDGTQRGKKIIIVAEQIPARGGPVPSPVERSLAARTCRPPRVTLPPSSPPRMPRPGPGSLGRGPWASRGGPLEGGPWSCQILRGQGPALAMAPRAGPHAGRGGPGGAAQTHSPMGGRNLVIPARAAGRGVGHEPALDVAPGVPDGSGSLLGFRARRKAGFPWAWTALGGMGLPASPALSGGLPGPIGARAPSPRPNREHTSPGPPSRSPAWCAPTGSARPCASTWGVMISWCRVAMGLRPPELRSACANPCGRGFPSRILWIASSSRCRGPVGRTGGSGPARDPGPPSGNARRGLLCGLSPGFSGFCPLCTLVLRVCPLGPEAGRPVRLGGTGVQRDDVTGEACSRGSKPGA